MSAGKRANENETLRKIPPSDPEARDEGPRLVPFPDGVDAKRPGEDNRRYFDLADKAIGKKKIKRAEK